MSPYEVSCAAKAGLLLSTVIREFMSVNTENAVRAFGRSVNRQRVTFPTRQGGFALDRGNKVATSAHNRKRTKSLRSFSSVSKSCSENNRIPVGSQSSSEQAAIGIDRKALAPPPRIAGRASGVDSGRFSFTIRAIKSGSSCSPDCFSFGCSRPNFLTKCRRNLDGGTAQGFVSVRLALHGPSPPSVPAHAIPTVNTLFDSGVIT